MATKETISNDDLTILCMVDALTQRGRQYKLPAKKNGYTKHFNTWIDLQNRGLLLCCDHGGAFATVFLTDKGKKAIRGMRKTSWQIMTDITIGNS